MLISNHQKLAKQSSKELSVQIGNQTLENVQCEKLLGVNIDSNLSWSQHIKYVSQRVGLALKTLCRIKKFLPESARITFHNAYILPHMDYCSTVWGGASTDINRLFIMQKRSARIILDAHPRDNHEPLFTRLKWQSIHDRIKYRRCLLVHKSINNKLPVYMSNMFTKISDIHTRTTRASAQNLYIKKPKTELFKKSFAYEGAILYNNLPADIKLAGSVNTFKSMYFKQTSHTAF